jgi:hypothetical protein
MPRELGNLGLHERESKHTNDVISEQHPCPSGPTLSTACPSTSTVVFWRCRGPSMVSDTSYQGLTLVHFSAQRKRFLWDRGCIEGLFRGYFAGV